MEKQAAEAPPPYAPQPGEHVHTEQIQMTTVPPQTSQPTAGQAAPTVQGQWTPTPAPIPGVPSGLEYLSQIDQLLIHQQIELLELVTKWETPNKYQIKNSLGQPVLFASEESGLCMRQCCGTNRGFVMHIANNFSMEVIRVIRDYKCCAGTRGCCSCSRCCQMEVSVEAPVGEVIGYVRQQCSLCIPSFVVQNASGEDMFNISGPCCQCQTVCCPKDITFTVSSAHGGHDIGRVYKQWSGFVREVATDADNFGVSFPMDLDVRMKALLLGSVFLIDFMFFERNRTKKKSLHPQ